MKKLLLVSVLDSLIISSSVQDFTFTSFSSNSFSTTVSSSFNTTFATDLSFAFDDIDSLNIVAMNDEEMDKTEGAIAAKGIIPPLVGVGLMTNGRIITTRMVTQKEAIKIASKDGGLSSLKINSKKRPGSNEKNYSKDNIYLQTHSKRQAKQIAKAATSKRIERNFAKDISIKKK